MVLPARTMLSCCSRRCMSGSGGVELGGAEAAVTTYGLGADGIEGRRSGLLPFDGARRFAGDVEHHPVHTLDLIDDAVGDFLE